MCLDELGVDKLSLLGKYILMSVVYYRLEGGGCPFENWVGKLERRSQIAVYDYIDRVAYGGSRKNVSSLGDGVGKSRSTTNTVLCVSILAR